MRTKIRKLVLIFGWVTLAALVIAVLVFYPKLKQRWSAPLGPGLELPTRTSISEHPTTKVELDPPDALASSADSSMPTIIEASRDPEIATSETLIPTSTPEPLCGGPPTMTILALGIDGSDDYRYGLSDVIRAVRVDFMIPKITVLSIPRDIWVEIPDIEEHYGITHGKLNQAYFYGTPGMGYYEGPGAGAGLLARTLDQNFGLQVEHYGVVNMQTFVKIVDAVGGIEIYLPTDVDGTPIDDKTEDMGYFYAGQQHFTGDEALRFSRIRKRYNGFARISNQNMVLCALKEKIVSPAVLPRIPQIIGAFQNSVLTDLSPEQMAQMACLVPKLDTENIVFASISEDLLTPTRIYSPQQKAETFVYKADFDVIRDIIDQFMTGTLVSDSDGTSCP
jgi:LCP family protein required for cell wall assembly